MNLHRHIKVFQLIAVLALILFLVACLKIFAFPDHKAKAQNGTGSQPVFFTNPTPAGTNLMGGVNIDQTTPGVTNGVQLLTGSTTAATQTTAANLNATVIGTGTFSVQNTAATPSGTNIIGRMGIDQTAPGTTNGVQATITPSGLVGTTGMSTTTASNLVIATAPVRLYSAEVVAGATKGFLLVFNATSLPANGAVNPFWCFPVASNSGVSLANTPLPMQLSVGGVVAFSTGATCNSLTAAVPEHLEAQYQ